jgi:phosphatidylglycerophosphate synthase
MNILKELKKIPNMITLFRLLCNPVLFYLAYLGKKELFGIVFLLSWASDGVDGFIARKMKQTSKFGAKFDSIVDDLSSILLFFMIWILFPDIVRDYGKYALILIFMLVLNYIFRIFKAKNIGIHLISSKIGGFLTGTMLLYIIFFDFSKTFFWIWFAVNLFQSIEIILVTLFKKDVGEKTKSLFF